MDAGQPEPKAGMWLLPAKSCVAASAGPSQGLDSGPSRRVMGSPCWLAQDRGKTRRPLGGGKCRCSGWPELEVGPAEGRGHRTTQPKLGMGSPALPTRGTCHLNSGKTPDFPRGRQGHRARQIELGWDPGTSWQWAGLACRPPGAGDPGSFWLGQVCLAGWWEQVAPAFLVVEKFFVPAGSNWGHCWPGAESPLWMTKAGDETPGLPMAGNVPALARVRSGPQAVVLEAGSQHWPTPLAKTPSGVWGLCAGSPEPGPWALQVGAGFPCLPASAPGKNPGPPGIVRGCYTCGLDPGPRTLPASGWVAHPRVRARAVMQTPCPLGWRWVTAPAGLN